MRESRSGECVGGERVGVGSVWEGRERERVGVGRGEGGSKSEEYAGGERE